MTGDNALADMAPPPAPPQEAGLEPNGPHNPPTKRLSYTQKPAVNTSGMEQSMADLADQEHAVKRKPQPRR